MAKAIVISLIPLLNHIQLLSLFLLGFGLLLHVGIELVIQFIFNDLSLLTYGSCRSSR